MNLAIKSLWVGTIIGYPLLLHVGLMRAGEGMPGPWLVFVPLMAIMGWNLFRMVARRWWPLLAGGLVAALWLVLSGNHGRAGLIVLDGAAHASVNLFLLVLFGRTLLSGQEPLVTQISRRIHGTLTPEISAYTRGVTIVWCLYFTAQLVVSLLLYLYASLPVWSFFINALNMPLLALMFAGEKAYRMFGVPHHPETSIREIIEVFRKDFAPSGRTAGRR